MKHETLAACAAVATILNFLAMAPAASAKGPEVFVIAPKDNVIVRHIDFADLNLASPVGERALASRVNAAVSDLCDESLGGRNGQIEYSFDMHACSVSAWGQAKPQMALALQRAREIALRGFSNIAAAALIITLPK